jgi:uncharacterized cofD-like protein
VNGNRTDREPETGRAGSSGNGLDTWLPRGIGLRRWALVLGAGVTVLGLGLAMLITNLYRQFILPQSGTALLYTLTLQFIPHPWRELLLALAGIGLLALGVRGVIRALQTAAQQGRRVSAPAILAPLRVARLPQGPRVVAIGGGTGMPNLLRGLKHVTDNITAVVTAADDGGSSGRLRREGMLPPGDFRNNLVALSEVEPLLEALFQYRFGPDSRELDGHAFGNLFIAAMVGVTGGFEQAIRESSRVLAVRGEVLPSTLADVTLNAELTDGSIVVGESRIPEGKAPVKRVFLTPERPHGFPDAIRAILAAELIVMGPGSLYTSVIPNLLVPDIAMAVKSSRAVKVYVCNVATQPGETSDFGVVDHVQALLDNVGPGIFDYVLVNSDLGPSARIRPEWRVQPVVLPPDAHLPGITFVPEQVVNPENPLRHDPERLAAALMKLYQAKYRADPDQPVSARNGHHDAEERVISH